MKGKSFQRVVTESIREIVFGLEDSLVSTLGTLTGIAIGSRSTFIVILSGFVLLAAEGMSMAAGSYLSSKYAFDAEQVLHADLDCHIPHAPHPIRNAVVMGVCYFVGGFVPLVPYFFLTVPYALILSIPITAVVLFLVGVWSSSFTRRSALRSGIEMVVISFSATFIGYLIGRAVSRYFGVEGI